MHFDHVVLFSQMNEKKRRSKGTERRSSKGVNIEFLIELFNLIRLLPVLYRSLCSQEIEPTTSGLSSLLPAEAESGSDGKRRKKKERKDMESPVIEKPKRSPTVSGEKVRIEARVFPLYVQFDRIMQIGVFKSNCLFFWQAAVSSRKKERRSRNDIQEAGPSGSGKDSVEQASGTSTPVKRGQYVLSGSSGKKRSVSCEPVVNLVEKRRM